MDTVFQEQCNNNLHWWDVINTLLKLGVLYQAEIYFDQQSDCQLFKRNFISWNSMGYWLCRVFLEK